jgi:hypothetical protein
MRETAPVSPILSLVAALATVSATACGPAEPSGSVPDALPLLTLSEPTLEIGVLDGDEAYTFAAIASVLRLEDGSIAVSDGGTTRIALYDERGAFLRDFASRGEGPGEFRSLSRIYRHGSDSLMAVDNNTARVSVFDLGGEYARGLDGVDLSGDTTFRLDSWLHGRFWVDGALDSATRSRARAVLDRLPPPRSEPGYRAVRVDRAGGLWIREPDASATATTWTRLGAEGTPNAVVEMPARFVPLDITGDELLGRWLGPTDVHFVRAYGLVETGETRPVPDWLQGADSVAVAATPAPDDEELMALMRGAIRSMASAQEIHYSSAYTYTTAIDSLRFEPPEGLGVAFTHAHPRGWAAVFTHPSVDRLCGLAYGADAPPGWVPGAIMCGPRSAAPAAPGS